MGKPHLYQDKEIRHFKGHPRKSAEISKTNSKKIMNWK